MAGRAETAVATIAAIATPPGPGAIGILRLSGPDSARIVRIVTGLLPPPRQASLLPMLDVQERVIDRGLVLFFPGPASYTGEDMVEFHTHGSPAILASLLQTVYHHGATPARPGEFTERAFVNGKLDLLQAEAVSDLISASTEQALRSANLAMSGYFSTAIGAISDRLIEIRALLEASIDFADEDSVEESDHLARLYAAALDMRARVDRLLRDARHGAQLARGQRVVLCGPPNAGKSTLMNALSGTARAIVSPTPGTTRDVLTTDLDLGGMLVTLTDTAGLHEVEEEIEQEGIRRALVAVNEADLILVIQDAAGEQLAIGTLLPSLPEGDERVLRVRNKIDLVGEEPGMRQTHAGHVEVAITAREERGLELLRACMHQKLAREAETDTPLLARERHLSALAEARALLDFRDQAEFHADIVETAERLRLAHQTLRELTGDFTSEDLLGEIFGRFCIGK